MALEVIGSNPITHPTKEEHAVSRVFLSILGCSQGGKAADFDSVIPQVRVLPSQPLKKSMCQFNSLTHRLFCYQLNFT